MIKSGLARIMMMAAAIGGIGSGSFAAVNTPLAERMQKAPQPQIADDKFKLAGRASRAGKRKEKKQAKFEELRRAREAILTGGPRVAAQNLRRTWLHGIVKYDEIAKSRALLKKRARAKLVTNQSPRWHQQQRNQWKQTPTAADPRLALAA